MCPSVACHIEAGPLQLTSKPSSHASYQIRTTDTESMTQSLAQVHITQLLCISLHSKEVLA